MNPSSRQLPPFGASLIRRTHGFSLVELLTVLVIISLLTATSASVIPSLFRSSQVDANISTLSGIFEQAREAAISGNTYVYVLFTGQLTSTPAGGVGVVVVQSQDGTDSLNNFTLGTTSSPLSISTSNNLLVLRKFQTLPGIQLTSSGSITSISNLPTAGASLQGSMGLTLTSGSTNYTFTQGVEFSPDGEARVSTWNDSVEFGIEPTLNSQSPNVAVITLTRLTGKLTVYRP